MSRKIVLTGGPASGKSTIINILRNKGISVVPEVATLLLDNGFYPLPNPWTPEWQIGLQEMITRAQVAIEMSRKEDLLVLDRGLYDGAAYLMKAGKRIDKAFKMIELWTDCSDTIRYDKVIVLTTVAKDENLYNKLRATNPVRFESRKEALALQDLIEKAWFQAFDKGYVEEMIVLETLDIEEKIKRVIELLN